MEKKTIHSHFGSIAELEAACFDAPFTRQKNDAARREYQKRDSGHGATWFGIDGGAAAVRKTIRDGWHDGAIDVDYAYDNVKDKIPKSISFARKRIRGDQGDDLDVQAVLSGRIATAWTKTRRAARLGNGNVRIVVDTCANAGMSAAALKWRGVAALALARTLLEARYSVEIVAAAAVGGAFNSRNHDENLIVSCVVKSRGEHTDTRMLAATCALSGFFRLHLFCALVHAAESRGRDINSSLGHALNLDGLYPADAMVSQIVTPASLLTRDAALAWVTKTHAFLQHFTIDKDSK